MNFRLNKDMINNIVNNRTNYESSLYHFAILAICVCSKRTAKGYYYDRGDFEKLKWDMKNC
jgi:hypothetical protein